MDMQKAKFTIEGYALKQLRMNANGSLDISFDRWKGKEIALILLEEPDMN